MLKPLTDDEILAIVQAEYHSAELWSDELATERERALDYYYGRPLGNEEEGHSQVVSSDVADVVEWLMPGLLRIFAGDDELVTFEPTGQNDRAARIATKLCQHVYNVDNDGFTNTHDCLKDGLLSKTGAMKVVWCEKKEPVDRDYEGLSEIELALLFQGLAADGDEGDIQIIGQEAEQQPDGTVTYNVRVRMMREWGQVDIAAIPPEELLIPRSARVIDDTCRYVGHDIRGKTRSDLVAMGIDVATVLDLPKADADWDTEEAARFNGFYGDDAPTQNKMMEPVEYIEHYVLADIDGDGIAERRLIVESGGKILRNEVLSCLPIAVWSPVRVPHSAVGRSIADRILDIQRIMTALMRGTLDNIYTVNAGGRYEVVTGQVNMDDLLTMRPGGVVRTKAPGMLRQLPTEYIGQQSMQVMEMVRTIREERTGVNKHNQGLNAESLHQTATGSMAILEQGLELQEMIARLFAEHILKKVYRMILDNVVRYQDGPREIRVAGESFEVDPSAFRERFNLKVKVGVGNMKKRERLAFLEQTAQKQALALQAGLPLVTPQHVYNTMTDMAELAGQAPGRYWMDPSQVPPQPKEQQPDPLVQAEMIKAQSREREAAARLQLQNAEATANAQLERERMLREDARQYTEMELKYSANVPGSKV